MIVIIIYKYLYNFEEVVTLLKISKKTLKIGIIGYPISHSLSPLIHNYWFEKYNIDAEYLSLEIAPNCLESFFKEIHQYDLRGFNITIPHKVNVLDYVDKIDESAKTIGAVNCVTIKSDKSLIGSNYDSKGFMDSLINNYSENIFNQKPVVVIGAGGASRAILYSLINYGIKEIRLSNRTDKKSEVLKKYFGSAVKVIPWNEKKRSLNDCGLLINTTNQGMLGTDPLNMDISQLPKEAIVIDLIYNPIDTDLIKRAKLRGNRTLNGLPMLVYQAIPAWESWFGIKPEVTKDLLDLLNKALE